MVIKPQVAWNGHEWCHRAQQVIGGLQRHERRLFHDRLRQLDRKILAATTKIGWAAPKHTIDAYCDEATRLLLCPSLCATCSVPKSLVPLDSHLDPLRAPNLVPIWPT